MNRRVKIFAIVGTIVILLIAWLLIRNAGNNPSVTGESTVTPQSAAALAMTMQSQQNQQQEQHSQVFSTPVPTQTLAPAVPTPSQQYPGYECYDGVCMWSSLCVSQHYTYEEWPGLGLTRVKPNSCEPLNFSKWYIRKPPEFPFGGMPCNTDDHECMWSTQCVTDYGLPSQIPGMSITKTHRDRCEAIP